MKALYKFHFDCGRQGELTGLFIAEQDAVKALIDSGDNVNFGEALGKHSEIYGPISPDDLTEITTDQSVLELMEKHKLCIGYNPFDYLDQ